MPLQQFRDACHQLDGETDSELSGYFTETQALIDLADDRSHKAIAVGLKGIGKSSSFRFLTAFDKSVDVSIGINPELYSVNLPGRLNFVACRKQFEQDLTIEALRAICSNSEKLKARCGSALLNRAKKHVGSYIAAVKEAAGNVTGVGISVLGCGFSINKGEARTLVGLTHAKDVEEARETLSAICMKGIRIRIVVDDPEFVFSASQELDPHLVGGFCLAAIRLSARTAGFKVIGFIKTHVYDPVLEAVEDLQSKYPDHAARLSWTTDELVNLVSKRLAWSELKWTEAFDSQSEGDAKSEIASIAGQTRNGPRDLLFRIYAASKRVGIGKKIAPTDLNATLKEASEQSFKEMETAHSASYTKLGGVVRAIFSDASRRKFKKSALQKHISDLMVNDEAMKSYLKLKWMQRENSQTLPQLLFEVGAIAIVHGSETILPFQPEYDQAHFDSADNFLLVPALAPHLEARV